MSFLAPCTEATHRGDAFAQATGLFALLRTHQDILLIVPPEIYGKDKRKMGKNEKGSKSRAGISLAAARPC